MTGDGDHPRVYFNGVRPDGSYARGPVTEEELVQGLLQQEPDWSRPPQPDPRGHDDPTRRPIHGVDTRRLDKTGWGVIFPAGVDQRVERALRPLLDWRREQATRERELRCRKLVVRPGESAEAFLDRHRAPRALANPDKLPYYLLVVGDPREIPFEFQFGLHPVYATGRLCFERPEEYEAYARSVVAAEKSRRKRPRNIALFGVENDGDRPTRRIHRELMGPLSQHLQDGYSPPWTVRSILGPEATRERLLRLLGGEETPALLFTGSHGMAVEPGEPEFQLGAQGAILCSDWRKGTGVRRHHYLAAEDVPDSADLRAVIAFHFACFSAGTPTTDSFHGMQEKPKEGEEPKRIAPHPFVARLPQRLLSHPNGGALAVVGHVDRAWTTSFSWNDPGQVEVFDSALRCLLDGEPIGAAMEYFDQLQGDTAVRLSDLWERRESLSSGDRKRFARNRLANRDARSFLVLGDPAVRLNVG